MVHGGIGYVDQLLAGYRVHAANDTPRVSRSGDAVRQRMLYASVVRRYVAAFSMTRFRVNLCRNAASRVQTFRRCGDRAGVRANAWLWFACGGPVALLLDYLYITLQTLADFLVLTSAAISALFCRKRDT